MTDLNRYSRQSLFSPIGEEGQRTLLEKRILIVGMGALGTVLANHFVRAGIGFIRFCDRDYVEMSNLQRQMLFDEDDVAQSLPKAVAAEKKLKRINSSIDIEGIVTDVNAKNIESLMEDVDLVVDGTDNFQTRYVLNDACYKAGIPFLYGGAVSSRGMYALLIPGETPCLRCLIPDGGSGGQTCDTVGVLAPVVDIVASHQVVEALKWLTGHKERLNQSLQTFDVWRNDRYPLLVQHARSNCPTCQQKDYPSLQYETDEVTTLCGRDTVQISHTDAYNLDEWASRLEPIANVQKTPFLLRATLESGEVLVLFPDGRTLVQGTEDQARAKNIFARYIGI
ncbi:ThiF family adenylyltransferase [Texcoconibacillus texcoconensis]|uniref:Adenylyltransferase/sulfurtransferase n=1 Tax=Texcoconibacillus texcoconensis TaxID=1095777 RepID=A0A840QP33_9BACI|nr:ThiF family adenylyltransferase [Texcoconibacillus texcoconensis]MBB5173130.1 adenylyltransferase/sulfurtransferase [Texcoconibacillus texcoconensis]